MKLWTELASILVLGVGANSENLPVGLAYGLRGLRIGPAPNLLIAGMTTAATIVPLLVGRSLRGYMSVALPDLLAGSLLVLRDRDAVFGKVVKRRLRGLAFGIDRSHRVRPGKNAHVERLIAPSVRSRSIT